MSNFGHGAVAPTTILEPSLSWRAIFAGAVTSGATTLALLVLAAAVGLAQISPWYDQNASATTFAVSTAIGLIVIQWISAALGGYMAGRLRPSWTRIHADETFFRDSAHGFLTWCVATLIVFACGALAASSITKGAAQVAGGVASAASQAAGPAIGTQAQYLSDMMFRGSGGATQATAQDREEATRILLSTATGEMAATDRDYLAQAIANRTGISADDARKRLDDVTAKLQAAKSKAQETAEQVRKASSRAALFTFLSLIVGAFVASVAGAFGGSLRNDEKARVKYFEA